MSDCDRLRVFAAAVHARRVGENPCALFIAVISRGLWKFISQADEDKARSESNSLCDPVRSGEAASIQGDIVAADRKNLLYRIIRDLASSRGLQPAKGRPASGRNGQPSLAA
ncbi:MAG: hypothetical protein KF841_03120 [Phycisphaerae bacterium]|nr:hypothetical protein [Phycisphaerae bacterium]